MAAWHSSNDPDRVSIAGILKRLAVREHGQTATEYAVLPVVLIASLATVVLLLQPPIQSLVGKAGEGVAGILP